MGMFDKMFERRGADEWQTKAYGCGLWDYYVGDKMPLVPLALAHYQVEILGGDGDGLNDAYATIRDGVLVSVGDERDDALPLLNYFGTPVS